MNNKIEHATDATFQEVVVNTDVPVLVDFWAPWCGPCRAVGPILEEVAGEYAERAKVVKINVDEETNIASSLGVRAIPTIILFHKGEQKASVIGARPKGELTELLDTALAA